MHPLGAGLCCCNARCVSVAVVKGRPLELGVDGDLLEMHRA